MSLMKVKATVDKDGVMVAYLPREFADATIDVFLDIPTPQSSSNSDFLLLLQQSFGSIPDLERPDQGQMPSIKTW